MRKKYCESRENAGESLSCDQLFLFISYHLRQNCCSKIEERAFSTHTDQRRIKYSVRMRD